MARALPLLHRGVCALLLAAGLAALGAPGRAHAWTDARVTSADAHVDVWASGQALVKLVLQIDVRAGYLSSFELSGLDPNLALDPDKPPSLLAADGRKARARPELRPDGSLLLAFDRASAPRRGRHQLELVYFTRLASEERTNDRPGLRFALPAFRADLEDVDIWISAPPGSVLATPRSPAPEFEARPMQLGRGARTVVHLHRAHLPRTLAIVAELQLPGPRRTGRPVADEPASRAATTPFARWLGLCVLALAALKLAALRIGGAGPDRAPRLLVPMPLALRAASMLALAAAGALLYPDRPVLGLGLLAALVSLAFGRPARVPGARTPLARAARLFSAASWLDATTPPGLSLLASGYLLAWCCSAVGAATGPGLELLLLVTPLFLIGTRLHTASADAAELPAPAQAPTDDPASPAAPAARSGGFSPTIAAAGRPARDRAA